MKKAIENATIVPAYKSYGVLAHEKRPVYTVNWPVSEIYDRISLAIPAEYEIYETALGIPGIVINGEKYFLSDLLTNYGDKPVLEYIENNTYHRVFLHTVD